MGWFVIGLMEHLKRPIPEPTVPAFAFQALRLDWVSDHRMFFDGDFVASV
ncbi:MAG: hypothetical protein WBC51_06355 [Vicinamibacterales bacterium]